MPTIQRLAEEGDQSTEGERQRHRQRNHGTHHVNNLTTSIPWNSVARRELVLFTTWYHVRSLGLIIEI